MCGAAPMPTTFRHGHLKSNTKLEIKCGGALKFRRILTSVPSLCICVYRCVCLLTHPEGSSVSPCDTPRSELTSQVFNHYPVLQLRNLGGHSQQQLVHLLGALQIGVLEVNNSCKILMKAPSGSLALPIPPLFPPLSPTPLSFPLPILVDC